MLMIAGVRMTMNSTGRKNRIIGTVSLAGRAAAFFSAADRRSSRFSLAMVRRAVPSGVPYFSAWIMAVATDLTPGWLVRLARPS
jgi:formate dehydrogenase assembly factor FdhD